jgi:hypothetical protein
MLRASVLLADSDEFLQRQDRLRIFRNGDAHFAVADMDPTGQPHPAIKALLPWAHGMPGCSILLTIGPDQADILLEAIR